MEIKYTEEQLFNKESIYTDFIIYGIPPKTAIRLDRITSVKDSALTNEIDKLTRRISPDSFAKLGTNKAKYDKTLYRLFTALNRFIVEWEKVKSNNNILSIIVLKRIYERLIDDYKTKIDIIPGGIPFGIYSKFDNLFNKIVDVPDIANNYTYLIEKTPIDSKEISKNKPIKKCDFFKIKGDDSANDRIENIIDKIDHICCKGKIYKRTKDGLYKVINNPAGKRLEAEFGKQRLLQPIINKFKGSLPLKYRKEWFSQICIATGFNESTNNNSFKKDNPTHANIDKQTEKLFEKLKEELSDKE